jgi:tetratricopeptide (TPR) repeat protein
VVRSSCSVCLQVENGLGTPSQRAGRRSALCGTERGGMHQMRNRQLYGREPMNPDLDDVEPEFNEALGLRDSGRREEALRILRGIAARKPDSAPVLGTIAAIQYEMRDFEGASAYFRRTTELSHQSELASRGLFHALYRLGRMSEAFEELARFRRVRPSAEYESTLEELLEEAERGLRANVDDEFFVLLHELIVGELRERPLRKGSIG